MKHIADLDLDQMSPPQRAVYDEVVSGPRKGFATRSLYRPLNLTITSAKPTSGS
jgi:hypothetical protein